MGFVVEVNGVQRIFIPINEIEKMRITQESTGAKEGLPEIRHTEIVIQTKEKS